MKKFLFLISAICIIGIGASMPMVFAQDGGTAGAKSTLPDLHVYYSEYIGEGAGDKVFHITSCLKTPSYAPLRCSQDLVPLLEDARQQCTKDGKIQEGTLIKGCVVKDGPPAQRFVDEGHIYQAVDISTYNQTEAEKGCSDKADDQGYRYGPEYAVIDPESLTTNNSSDAQLNPGLWRIKGTISWLPDQEIPPEVINKIYPDGVAHPLYRPTLCAQWDKLPDLARIEVLTKVPSIGGGQLQKLIDDFNSEANVVDEDMCNRDNSTEAIGTIEQSTPFDKNNTYSCSVQYRITGKTGVDILAKYVSAIYRWAAGIVGIVAVLMMVYAGIQLSMAGGDTGKIDEAKKRITQALIGLAILFLSGLILYTINPTFFTG